MKNHTLMVQTDDHMVSDIEERRASLPVLARHLLDNLQMGYKTIWACVVEWNARCEAARMVHLSILVKPKRREQLERIFVRILTEIGDGKKPTSITFTHSGVTGRAEVNGKEVFIRYAGAGFQLSAAREGLRQTVIAALSKAGLLPKGAKS